MQPLKRYINLLKLERKEIIQIFLYAIFSGIISLSLPLGIQAIINFIQAGRVSASWIVLVILVIIGVLFGGVLSLMQLRITENLQQKIFIRSSFEFAYRIPKIKFDEIYKTNHSELATRFFDTLTIQKGTAKLLLDFSAALLQITFGIILLSLYHSSFIVFGLLLVGLLYFIFKYSYEPGLNSSLKESKYKYKVASWLQELARNSFSFKNPNHLDFALEKNNNLVSDYLISREKHFKVIKKQFFQLILFKVIITAGLLLIGGLLVINQQMNIGQFVAAEIIILLVINSVEKIIIGLETFYDVLTSVEKIGQVTDLEIEPENNNLQTECYLNLTLDVENASYKFIDANDTVLQNINLQIKQGEKIIINGENGSGKTTLIRLLSGFLTPNSGHFSINDDTFNKIDINQYRKHFGSVLQGETLFEGTILENLTFNNSNISKEDLKWALDGISLTSYIKALPDGIQTKIYPNGKQLSSSNIQKILLARSILQQPRLLFLENAFDKMDNLAAEQVINFLMHPNHKWTIIGISKNNYFAQKCNRIIQLEKGKIVNDLIR